MFGFIFEIILRVFALMLICFGFVAPIAILAIGILDGSFAGIVVGGFITGCILISFKLARDEWRKR